MDMEVQGIILGLPPAEGLVVAFNLRALPTNDIHACGTHTANEIDENSCVLEIVSIN